MLPVFNKFIEAYGTDSQISPCKKDLTNLKYLGHSAQDKSGLPSMLPEFNKFIEAYGTDSRISPCKKG